MARGGWVCTASWTRLLPFRRFPDEAALDALLTINAAGTGTDLPGHLAQLAACEEGSRL